MTTKRTAAIVHVAKKPNTLTGKNPMDIIRTGLEGLAKVLSGPLTPKTLGPALVSVREFEKVLRDYTDIARGRVLELLEKKGEQVTDKGTWRAVADGWSFEARPYRTGIDPKKLEALLRAKGLDPETGMDAVVTYRVNEEKVGLLIGQKKLTQQERDAIEYDLSWTVQTPKRQDA